MKPLLALILVSIALVVANAAPEKKAERERLVIVSVTEFSVGSKWCTSIEALKAELEIRVRAEPHFALLIIPPEKAAFGVTIMVLDACRQAGVSDIKVDGASSDPKKPNQSPEPTSVLGTSAAEPPRVPSTLVAHL